MSRDIPIIFSGPMVRALLEGRKTQTRRLAWRFKDYGRVAPDYPGDPDYGRYGKEPSPWQKVKPGDRLYVRETWRTERAFNGIVPRDLPWVELPGMPIWYEADGGPPELSDWGNPFSSKRRVAIHLPRWASRLTLEVTAVKIERLKEISHEDAVAEGCARIEPCPEYPHGNAWGRAGFAALWDSLHGEGSFDTEPSPEVVALTFKVHKTNIDTRAKAEAA